MKKQLYSIKDDLSFDFEPPFSAVTDVACLRMVSPQIQSESVAGNTVVNGCRD